MANLKEIRNRISSVGSTMQITSAMKMVSAAKLKKAQDAITAMRPYAETLTALLQNLSLGSTRSFTTISSVDETVVAKITRSGLDRLQIEHPGVARIIQKVLLMRF